MVWGKQSMFSYQDNTTTHCCNRTCILHVLYLSGCYTPVQYFYGIFHISKFENTNPMNISFEQIKYWLTLLVKQQFSFLINILFYIETTHNRATRLYFFNLPWCYYKSFWTWTHFNLSLSLYIAYIVFFFYSGYILLFCTNLLWPTIFNNLQTNSWWHVNTI